LLVAAVGLLAGCSAAPGGAPVAPPSASAAPAFDIPPGPSLPPCAEAGPPITPPDGFPVTFPLPPGSVVVDGDVPPGGGSRIKFLAPIDVPALGEFLEKELPRAGLSIGGGEAEADELESKFSGQGLDGQVIAREVSACPGVLSVQVVVRPT
jgi:hypothetical protein